MMDQPFSPYQSLATTLMAYLPEGSEDGSHDISHIHRVWTNAKALQKVEGGDLEILLAATLLHDCVAVEKNSPLRAQASTLSAQKASSILAGMGWSESRILAVAHAVKTHSFSAGFEPTTVEAKILQDSDRLDAIGAVGVARCFYIAGRMGSALYDFTNPTASNREYQDKRFAIEHFHTKLLKLASGFQTAEGARIAAIRHQRLERFLNEFMDETGAAEAYLA
ncbi:HD domain-containing protein [Pseudomonas gingeri]|uniref:HD domain-containing protein n=1 Tax=Pseudomonas gingeri TaxID=117681 RepID=A0A7Y7XBG1_9PSED|nr:HD domain-containing protein [Pseudomonas gingeri]NWB96785.1 HD domain-containing protein [Pseudomonas gingeri]